MTRLFATNEWCTAMERRLERYGIYDDDGDSEAGIGGHEGGNMNTDVDEVSVGVKITGATRRNQDGSDITTNGIGRTSEAARILTVGRSPNASNATAVSALKPRGHALNGDGQPKKKSDTETEVDDRPRPPPRKRRKPDRHRDNNSTSNVRTPQKPRMAASAAGKAPTVDADSNTDAKASASSPSPGSVAKKNGDTLRASPRKRQKSVGIPVARTASKREAAFNDNDNRRHKSTVPAALETLPSTQVSAVDAAGKASASSSGTVAKAKVDIPPKPSRKLQDGERYILKDDKIVGTLLSRTSRKPKVPPNDNGTNSAAPSTGLGAVGAAGKVSGSSSEKDSDIPRAPPRKLLVSRAKAPPSGEAMPSTKVNVPSAKNAAAVSTAKDVLRPALGKRRLSSGNGNVAVGASQAPALRETNQSQAPLAQVPARVATPTSTAASTEKSNNASGRTNKEIKALDWRTFLLLNAPLIKGQPSARAANTNTNNNSSTT